MKFETFNNKILEYLKENLNSINERMQVTPDYSYRNNRPFSYDENEIEVRWTTGGAEGGSCWDDTPQAKPFTVEAQEPDFWIDLFIELMCPGISYLTYKRIKPEIINSENVSFYEYYGNCTFVRITKLNFRHFYNVLSRENLI
jgi:hypothetical protein